MRKNLKLVALSCVLALSLTACGNEKDKQTESQAPSTTEETKTPEAPKAEVTLSYEFSGTDSGKSGYAEGKISLSSTASDTYKIYWSDDSGALKGYYEIATLEVATGKTSEIALGYHTAIPADATKVIAVSSSVTSEYPSVTDASAVFDIPSNKKLSVSSKDAVYTFNSFSDIHIDEEHFGETPAYWWEYSEAHWANALDYANKLGVDFIISSGDQVTNAKLEQLDEEWKAYQLILSQSDYVNPIYESGGNHEVRQDGAVTDELQTFITSSGLNSSMDTLSAKKPYYSITEPKSGDLFIFMALEAGYRPNKYDQFSDDQLNWLESLLQENYGKGKNIYVIQHALIKGYGPGDDLETPYYGGAMNGELPSAKRFISILEKYKDIVWISGHSHEDFTLDYNYTNNNGASCNMIHNPSVSNPTHVTDGAIDYTFDENLSQGYYVQTFESAIIFNGANLIDRKIYPAYSYIIDGKTSKAEQKQEEKLVYTDVEVTDGTLRSVLANVNTVLGLYYEYSSYDQYQALKKLYYEYKDADTAAMSADDVLTAYSKLRLAIAYLHQIVQFTNGVAYEVVLPTPPAPSDNNNSATRESEILLRVHYHRADGNYDPWSVWLWGTGEGTDNKFTGKDDYGVYLEYVVDVETTKVGFIVRTENWDKDVESDQFIPLDGITTDTYDIYIESGVEGFTTK